METKQTATETETAPERKLFVESLQNQAKALGFDEKKAQLFIAFSLQEYDQQAAAKRKLEVESKLEQIHELIRELAAMNYQLTLVDRNRNGSKKRVSQIMFQLENGSEVTFRSHQEYWNYFRLDKCPTSIVSKDLHFNSQLRDYLKANHGVKSYRRVYTDGTSVDKEL